METILTTEQRKLLLARHRNERDKRVADRIKAVVLRDEGMSYREIARVLFLTDEGARQQVEDFLKKNGKLEPENGGSEARLSDEQTKRFFDTIFARHDWMAEYTIAIMAIAWVPDSASA